MADDLHAAVGFVLKHLISKRRNRVSKALDTAQENNNAMGATDALTKDCHWNLYKYIDCQFPVGFVRKALPPASIRTQHLRHVISAKLQYWRPTHLRQDLPGMPRCRLWQRRRPGTSVCTLPGRPEGSLELGEGGNERKGGGGQCYFKGKVGQPWRSLLVVLFTDHVIISFNHTVVSALTRTRAKDSAKP